MRSYEKEESSRKKRSGGMSSSASSSNLSSMPSNRRSRMRPRLDTADGVNSSMQSSSGIISASSSSHNLTIARPGEKSLVRTGSGVHFGTAESRSRSNSEAVPLEPVSPPQQSPALSQHKATVITSSSSTSTSANTAANSVAQRVTFNTGANRVLDEHLSAQQFAFLSESKLLFTCGHWDHSCRITNTETGNLVQSMRQQRDVITCLALAKDFGQRWLVTGSRDCTLMVWDVNLDREQPLNAHPQYILYGHDDAVTCVAINPELDVVVSGSDDGTVNVHNLRDGSYVRTISDKCRPYVNLNKPLSDRGKESVSSDLLDDRGRRMSWIPSSSTVSGAGAGNSSASNGGSSSNSNSTAAVRKITWLGLSKEAYVITYSSDDQMLCTYSLNGVLISSRTVPEALYAFMLSEDGKVLLTGGSSCLVVFRWVSQNIHILYY